ncbi:MAG: DUF924 domain-containing protein [Desulfobulbaceae bacterium]|nr:DUF924 domain-containing protein [Desulfobulbaceae bacterium]
MYQDILNFWFTEISQSQWWSKDTEFDQLIIDRFSDIHSRAVRCELFEWRDNVKGRLAEIIVLDQFSRNMFRGEPLAFSNDPMTLVLSQEAVSLGVDKLLNPVERNFLYLPFMHSESLIIHGIAENLYRQDEMQSNLEWELRHKEIIRRFGRYPHRNKVLGRKSTAEEIDFLKRPDSSF